MTTLIIGASGNIGRIVVESLGHLGRPPRALVRRPDKALEGAGAEVVLGDLEAGIGDALEGMGRVTTVVPDDPQTQWIPRADVARAIIHCLETPATVGQIYPLFHGERSIRDALV